MCGIAGLVGRISPTNREALKRMSQAIVHRGPDASGFWESEPDGQGCGVMLAHRRLSILDLSPAGAQPMRDPDSGNVVVFNGEIYNYVDLRAQLESQGHHVRSTGDTAVLLKALSTKGPQATATFRGMFAFAYWDLEKRQLLLARDALGIKPLYIYQNPDPQGEWTLAFASEAQALLAGGLIASPRLNPDTIASVAWNGFTVAPSTALLGVETLWPGEQRTYGPDGKERHRERHWTLEPKGSQPPVDEETLARELEECVRLHLASDVPLGVFLSGGIDSSVLANIAQKSSSQPIHTFTLAFEEADQNEGHFARKIADAIGTHHQELVLTQNYFISRLDNALDSLDQPTFDGLNSYFMSHSVRDAGLKVALVGSGGDELFGGYTSFRDLPPLNQFGQATKWVPMALKTGVAKVLSRAFLGRHTAFPPQTRWAKLPEMVACEDDLVSLYQLAYALFLPRFQSELLVTPPSSSTFQGLPAPFRALLLAETKGRTALEAISVLEQRLFLGERLLRDTDAVSMSASLEIRLPLVDQNLVTLLNRVPDHVRFHPLRKKALLRRIGLKGLAPELFDRPKAGFELPYNEWMRSSLGRTIDETLRDRDAVLNVGLNPSAVVRLWEAFKSDTPGLYWSRVWALYVLVRWAHRHSLKV